MNWVMASRRWLRKLWIRLRQDTRRFGASLNQISTKSKLSREIRNEFDDPAIAEGEERLFLVYESLLDYQQLFQKLINTTKATKDMISENHSISILMCKQLNLFEPDRAFINEDTEAIYADVKPNYESALSSNANTYRALTDKYEGHLFAVANTYDDLCEALNTVDKFYEYKEKCLKEMKSLVS